MGFNPDQMLDPVDPFFISSCGFLSHYPLNVFFFMLLFIILMNFDFILIHSYFCSSVSQQETEKTWDPMC